MATLTLRTVAAGGLKPESEFGRTRRRRAVLSPKDAASPRSRELNERPINVFSLSWKKASDGQKRLLEWLWRNTLGTTLPMNFTPAGKTDASVEDVYFTDAPKISRAGPTTWAMSFEVEGRH
jgi:hypothetical protein